MTERLPEVTITIDQDGAEVDHKVRLIIADIVRFDIMRKRFDFPQREEAPITFMAVAGYAALVRTGKVPNTTKVEKFLETIINIDSDEVAGPGDDDEGAGFPAV